MILLLFCMGVSLDFNQNREKLIRLQLHFRKLFILITIDLTRAVHGRDLF
jgi:hypothetical protein